MVPFGSLVQLAEPKVADRPLRIGFGEGGGEHRVRGLDESRIGFGAREDRI
jgi:hypothetical protein